MLTALIVDDIAESRINLKADLQDYCPNVSVVGEAESVISALKAIKELKPQIVFLDIHLGDGTGFDILELLPQIDFKVIFTTASDAFAIKAFKYSAIDYLLKPIDPDELVQAVEHAIGQYRLEHQQVELLMENMQQKDKAPPQKLALSTQEKIHVVDIQSIIRCESNDNYTTFFFTDGTKVMVSKTLKTYDQLLKDADFLRVHQRHLVNQKHVREFVKTDGGYLIMDNGSSVPVSTRKRAEVVEAISRK